MDDVRACFGDCMNSELFLSDVRLTDESCCVAATAALLMNRTHCNNYRNNFYARAAKRCDPIHTRVRRRLLFRRFRIGDLSKIVEPDDVRYI